MCLDIAVIWGWCISSWYKRCRYTRIIYTWSLRSICLAKRTGILTILREPKAWRCTCKKMCHGKRAYTAIHYHIHSERCRLCPIKMGQKRRDTNTKRNVTLHHIIWLHRRKGYGVDDCKTFATIGFVGALRFINFVKSSIRFRSTHLTMWCCRSPTEPEIARIWAHCGWPIAKVAIFVCRWFVGALRFVDLVRS
jgi:hypothetical protein